MMLIYIALSLAVAVGTVSCTDCSRDCKGEFWDNAKRNKPSQICGAGKAWRKCLDELQQESCEVTYPQELDISSRSCDEQDPPEPAVNCDEAAACSRLEKLQWYTDKRTRSCRLARAWRECLDDFNGKCDNVEYPFELNQAEAVNCYAQPDADCSGLAECSKQADIDAAENKKGKCRLAQEWRVCLDGFDSDCAVTYPFELNDAEANNCDFTTCSERKTCTTEELINAAHSKHEKCQLAKEWRSCLDDFLGDCDVTYPEALDIAQATNC